MLWVLIPTALGLLFVALAAGGASASAAGGASASATGRASASAAGPSPLGITGRWRLVLNAPFNGRKLDAAVWRTGWFGTGLTGPINSNEDACYRSSHVRQAGGVLMLGVSHTASSCQGRRRPYTGAIISSDPEDGRTKGGFSFRYGIVQARVYFPGIRGEIANWPAVLTLGQKWPEDGEDDVAENLGGIMCSHFHSAHYAYGSQLGGCAVHFTPGWHTVSANWEPGSVTWYYDGRELARATRGVSTAPMYIAVVNTVSKYSLKVARADVLRIAYIRVWQRA